MNLPRATKRKKRGGGESGEEDRRDLIVCGRILLAVKKKKGKKKKKKEDEGARWLRRSWSRSAHPCAQKRKMKKGKGGNGRQFSPRLNLALPSLEERKKEKEEAELCYATVFDFTYYEGKKGGEKKKKKSALW